MNAWIVVLLLAAAFSPLVWIVPSRRQRGQMDVRLAARRMGLGMQMARPEWPHWMQPEPPAACPQYHRQRLAGRGDWSFWQVAPGEWHNRWREPCVDEPLLQLLRRLPADVYQVDANKQMLALYWGERGGEEELKAIVEVMQQLARL